METITNKTLEKLKYDLVRAGLVPYETIEQAEEIANAQNINIGQALINSGILTEETIIKFLESKLHIPSVNLEDYTLDENCLKYISYSDARKYRIIPLFKIEDTLTVAMADPLDLFAIDKVVETAACSIEPVIASETSILKKIEANRRNEIQRHWNFIFHDGKYPIDKCGGKRLACTIEDRHRYHRYAFDKKQDFITPTQHTRQQTNRPSRRICQKIHRDTLQARKQRPQPI